MVNHEAGPRDSGEIDPGSRETQEKVWLEYAVKKYNLNPVISFAEAVKIDEAAREEERRNAGRSDGPVVGEGWRETQIRKYKLPENATDTDINEARDLAKCNTDDEKKAVQDYFAERRRREQEM